MAFTQNCFIRKNTQDLRDKLKEFGWRQNDFDEDDRCWIAANYGMFISVDPGFQRLFPDDIDCGTNEEMFLALAALRDDTDRYQWFICTEEYISTHTMDFVKVGTWQLNTKYRLLTYGLKHLWRKATTEEIVEHFKKKE